MAAAARWRVVFDDAQIGLIRVKQQLKQIPQFGVEVGGLQWDKMAEGFGADGVVVDNEQALEAALKAALASGRTTVIGAKIDGSGYVDQFNAPRNCSTTLNRKTARPKPGGVRGDAGMDGDYWNIGRYFLASLSTS